MHLLHRMLATGLLLSMLSACGGDSGEDACISMCEKQSDCGGGCDDGGCDGEGDGDGSFLGGEDGCDDMCDAVRNNAAEQGCSSELDRFMICIDESTDGCDLDSSACQDEANAFAACGSAPQSDPPG